MFSKPLLCVFSVLFCCEALAQDKSLIVYDIATKQQLKLPTANFDSTLERDKTLSFSGIYDQAIIDLPLTIPQDNLYDNTNFTNKLPAQETADIRDFPFSTTIKLVVQDNGELFHNCSAVMISSRHVLTAAHCLIDINTPNDVVLDSIFAIPMYNNGTPQTDVQKGQVQKIYFFENWTVGNGEDIMVLELDKPIGKTTGWLGIGYDKNDDFFEENNFHKLSYPGNRLFDDKVDYNGDTMYYAYGRLGFLPNHSSHNFLGVPSHNGGRSGESGSSLFYTNNDDIYVTFGVLNMMSNYRHSRIQDWQFNAIKSVIKEDTKTIKPTNDIVEVTVYPNPTQDKVRLKFNDFTKDYVISIYDINGRSLGLVEMNRGELETNIDLTAYPKGLYVLNISNGEQTTSKKVLKN